ncbi:MAG: hypothetical protein IT305_31095 [Chloroflexi bacterium]|nr:hypothetical protein [Chloroflexota bacterium]
MVAGAGNQQEGSERGDDRALHARLLQADPTATSDLAIRFLAPLADWLRGAFRRVDPDVLESVATDLILNLGQRPTQYDPDKGGLMAYLRMAAKADVLNALKRERRRTSHEMPLEVVELRPPARNTSWAGASDPADAVADAADGAAIASALEHLDARDREVVRLMMQRERRTAIFADVLGVHDRPPAEQAREVKRVKDRLKKHLQRHWLELTDDA